ncbi:MAG: hypothetical protein FWC26_11715 [Fibromonadales bacterium]|nr:hypothetical protein [Fibromonadales bacterium]
MRLLYITFSILIVSCATSEMNVEKGTFQAIKPPNIYGNNRHLTKDENYTISYNANIGKNKTVPLPGITNQYTLCTNGYNNLCSEGVPANINYRLIENTLGFQFHKTTKDYKDVYLGGGFGIQNFPYGFFMFGYNGKSIEVGGSAFWGLVVNKASYGGMWYYLNDFTMGWTSDTEYFEYVKLKDAYILHSYGGLVLHASYYVGKFSLNYAASVSNPWFLTDELPISKSYDADISFSFPALLMQDIGISYTPHKIQYRLGVNQITGVEFPGQYWGLSVQIAYGW